MSSSAAVHIPDPSGQVNRALIEGTPEHFTLACRGHSPQGVQLHSALDRDFHVPSDGIWMINGMFAVPGETRQLGVGDIVTYHRVQRAPDNDEPTRKIPFLQMANARIADPETGRLIRFVTPAQAVAMERRGRR